MLLSPLAGCHAVWLKWGKSLKGRFVQIAMPAILTLIMSLSTLAEEETNALPQEQPVSKAANLEPRQLVPLVRLSSFPSWVTSVAFSPDGKLLAAGINGAVQFIDLDRKSVIREIVVRSGQVRALSFSSDGTVIATGGYQNVSLWDLAQGGLVKEFKGHRGYVTSLAFSPDGRRLATASDDETAYVWTVEGTETPLLFKKHRLPVTGVAWSPDGMWIATSAGDDTRPTRGGEVKIWAASTGEVEQSFELHAKGATGVAFSHDGAYLASSGMDENVNVYDIHAKKALGFFAGHSRPVNAVVFHPDRKTAISISGGRAVGKNELKIWELATGEELATAEGHESRITAVALSRNGETLATGGHDKSLAVWDIGFLSIGLPEVTVTQGRPEAPKKSVQTK